MYIQLVVVRIFVYMICKEIVEHHLPVASVLNEFTSLAIQIANNKMAYEYLNKFK